MAWRLYKLSPRHIYVRRLVAVLFGLSIAIPTLAQSLDVEVAGLAAKISKTLVGKSKSKVAVLDFTDLQGRPTELGRFLAEQLSIDLVNSSGMSVMDRAHLKSILDEHKFSESGLVSPEGAKKLGQFAGVDAILLGTVTSMEDDMVLTAKAISTETAEIIAANKATFRRTKDTHQLVTQSVGGRGALGADSGVRTADAISTNDFGDLRVTTKTAQLTRGSGHRNSTDAIYCTFEFTNRNLKEPLLVAANGQSDSLTALTAQIRTSSGGMLMANAPRGLAVVCVYGRASPAVIAQTIITGQKIERRRGYFDGERLWMGELTTIPPGESIQVSLTFAPGHSQDENLRNIDRVQLEFEFVAGTGTRGPKALRLHVLTLNGVPVSGGGL